MIKDLDLIPIPEEILKKWAEAEHVLPVETIYSDLVRTYDSNTIKDIDPDFIVQFLDSGTIPAQFIEKLHFIKAVNFNPANLFKDLFAFIRALALTNDLPMITNTQHLFKHYHITRLFIAINRITPEEIDFTKIFIWPDVVDYILRCNIDQDVFVPSKYVQGMFVENYDYSWLGLGDAGIKYVTEALKLRDKFEKTIMGMPNLSEDDYKKALSDIEEFIKGFDKNTFFTDQVVNMIADFFYNQFYDFLLKHSVRKQKAEVYGMVPDAEGIEIIEDVDDEYLTTLTPDVLESLSAEDEDNIEEDIDSEDTVFRKTLRQVTKFLKDNGLDDLT